MNNFKTEDIISQLTLMIFDDYYCFDSLFLRDILLKVQKYYNKYVFNHMNC